MGHCSASSSGYHSHAISCRKARYVFFKTWGSNLSHFFRIHFKGERLELLAPICKREKRKKRERSVPTFYRKCPSLHWMGV